MTRKLMTITLNADDFKCKDDGALYDDTEATIDADVEPADPSVGFFSASADVFEVMTKAGGDIVELLTQPALERLGDEYLQWLEDEAYDSYMADVDYRIKERKEEGV